MIGTEEVQNGSRILIMTEFIYWKVENKQGITFEMKWIRKLRNNPERNLLISLHKNGAQILGCLNPLQRIQLFLKSRLVYKEVMECVWWPFQQLPSRGILMVWLALILNSFVLTFLSFHSTFLFLINIAIPKKKVG